MQVHELQQTIQRQAELLRAQEASFAGLKGASEASAAALAESADTKAALALELMQLKAAKIEVRLRLLPGWQSLLAEK